MTSELRKVKFTLGRYCFYPDATFDEIAEQEELTKERIGYFHRWVEDVDTSKDIPFIRPYALVEDLESGKVHEIDYDLVTFINEIE
ncbi:MAG: hypothetical protein K2G90_01460 [Muribaculaceae bacterium]|nr:hypothetical protein [Muribaculaceae bacterium]